MKPTVVASQIVVRYVLEHRASTRPDDIAVTFADGQQWTNAEALVQAYRAANALAAEGVRQDDRVGIFLWNGAEFLRAWWGSACLGATIATYNVSYRGAMLDHAIGLSRPRLIITEDDLLNRVAQLVEHPPVVDPAILVEGEDTAPELDRPIELWDIHCVTLTSGTTGPSKASLTTYFGLHQTGSFYTVEAGLDADDTCLVDLPLFHQAALSFSSTAMSAGCRLAIRKAPDLTNYWTVVKETGATMSFVLATMLDYLLARPPSPQERDHRLRYVMLSPAPVDPSVVLERFGVTDYITGYGATEISGPIVRRPGEPTAPESVGRLREGYEVRLVDEHDMEVAPGEVGELIVRTEQPWALSAGYVDDPGTTAKAWRNGWWHSGDLLRRDSAGNYFFHDRLKDAVRRRGENISTFEVEREVKCHPMVGEVACVPVPIAAGGEEEVKVWIVPAAGASVNMPVLVEYLAERMPHFMVPRFYELTDALPKTESLRVKKHLLKEYGNSEQTWDLEAYGWRMTRNGLVKC